MMTKLIDNHGLFQGSDGFENSNGKLSIDVYRFTIAVAGGEIIGTQLRPSWQKETSLSKP